MAISAPIEVAWAFLVDPHHIAASMPDVQEYQVTDETHFTAKVKVGIGPVRAVLDLTASVEPLSPPREARLQVRGGGMGSGLELISTIVLDPGDGDEPSTQITWTAQVGVSGPLATLGGRLLDSQVKKTTEQVFANIQQGLAAQAAVDP